jgi:glycosyltransferase involved in cell wall biosynthesis
MSILQKEVLWVFSNRNPDNIPSNVVSCILPAKYLNIKMIIFLPSFDAKKTLDKYQPSLIIVGAVFYDSTGILKLIEEAKLRGIKVIVTIADWNLEKKTEHDVIQNQIKLSLSKLANCIIVPTMTKSLFIKDKLNINTEVIPDCIRFTHSEPISKIIEPLELVWFGNNSNHDTFLEKALPEIFSVNIKVNIKVITRLIDNIKKNIKKKYFSNIKFYFVEWTPEMVKEVILSDIAIIPYLNDNRRLVKSQNRIVDAMSMGRFVITSDVSLADEFKSFCYVGDIGEGCKWVLKNPKKALIKCNLGKQYVDNKFSVKKISKLWEKIILKNLKKT